jgi:hypothetical protein
MLLTGSDDWTKEIHPLYKTDFSCIIFVEKLEVLLSCALW